MLSIIVAIADNNAIGRNGDLVFHISADLKHFKQLTMGHAVIMGRKTFESLPGGALPGRRNIVVTRNPAWTAPGVETATSLRDAIALAGNDAFIIGGAQIYAEALPLAHTLYITRIFADAPGADTFFPPIPSDWHLTEAGEILQDAAGIPFQFQTLQKSRS